MTVNEEEEEEKEILSPEISKVLMVNVKTCDQKMLNIDLQ